KDSRSSTVMETELPVRGEMRRVIGKRFLATAWSDPFAALCRPTPALRSWRMAQALRLRCLPTPRPLAVLHRRRHGLSYEGYLLAEKVEGARDLHEHLAHLEPLPPAERRARLRRLLDRLGKLVRDLHDRGLSHRDLKAPNLLVAPTGNPRDPEA